MVSQEQMEQYCTEGYFVADNPPPDLEELVAAGKRVKARVRAGEVDVYTHWAGAGEPWCIRGLLAPEMGEPVFAKHMISNWAMDYSRAFIGAEMRLGWIDLRTNPHDKDFPGGWHRDLALDYANCSLEEEMEQLNKPEVHTRWYVPLVDDACLFLVPGSHLRGQTDEERNALVNDKDGHIPGQKCIEMKKGQVGFWNGKTIHKGEMKKDVERLTLAASWRKHSDDDPPEKIDGRFEWRLRESVREALPEKMHLYYDRWKNLQLSEEAA